MHGLTDSEEEDIKLGSTRIMLTIPVALLKKIDELAKLDYTSRSAVVRHALLNHVREPANSKSDDDKLDAIFNK